MVWVLGLTLAVAIVLIGWMMWRITQLNQDLALIRPSAAYYEMKAQRAEELARKLQQANKEWAEREKRIQEKGVTDYDWSKLSDRRKKLN